MARRNPATRSGALARIGKRVGINPETLRDWVDQAETDDGRQPGVSIDEAARMAAWSGRTGSCAGRVRT